MSNEKTATSKKVFWRRKNNLSNKARVALALFAFVFANALISVLVMADGESIDQTLLIKWPGTPQVNEYVQYNTEKTTILENALKKVNRVFCTNENARETGECTGIKVSKKVGCIEGDRLEVKNGNAFYCNNVLIGYAKKTTKDGQPLTMFNFNGVVPKGKIFAYGTNKDSYDSRYYGFVDVSKVQRLKGLFDAKPLLTS